ncbi:glycosyltransferase family 4 protein [Sulfitobacter sp.]|uniref:glycosyltransferase family 4 protein n=1 Tax=Sulfitobacter sp. TaxID=1903071 RepID=UPI003569EE24
MTPTVAYFANQFAAAEGHGMRRYAFELYDAITELGGAQLVPAAGWSNLAPDALSDLQTRTSLRLMKTGRKGTSLAWTLAGFPPMEWMMPDQLDVVHSVCMGYPVATRKPLVVTIHDLGPLTHPEFFSHNRPWVMERALKQAVDKAATVVAISQATADEILSLHPQAADRVRVVHSGVAERFFDEPDPAALDGLDLPPDDVPFILTAGSLNPRKNVLGVMQALRHALQDIPHHLVLAGGGGWDMEQLQQELGSSDLAARVHRLGFVSDEALRALYRRAAMYLHPSLYEGFGLTLLEAMAAGTPVVTSNRSSLPEIAGDAALLVDPTDPNAIAEAVIRLANDQGLVDTLREKGFARARSFSWNKTAQTMKEIYQDAASG